MSENNEPIAQEPTVSENVVVPNSAGADTAVAEVSTAKKRRTAPWAIVAATAVIAATAGFGISTAVNDGPIHRTSLTKPIIGDEQGPGHEMNGHEMNGQGRGMGPGQGMKGQGMAGQDRGTDPDGDNSNGGRKDGAPRAPHCHDTTGADVAIDANGLCPDGSKPPMPRHHGGQSQLGNGSAPGPLDQAAPSATSSPS